MLVKKFVTESQLQKLVIEKQLLVKPVGTITERIQWLGHTDSNLIYTYVLHSLQWLMTFRFYLFIYFATYYFDLKIVGQQLASRARIIHQIHNDFCITKSTQISEKPKERRKRSGRTNRYSSLSEKRYNLFSFKSSKETRF